MTYIVNLDRYESIGTHWIALYVSADNVTDVDSFVVEHTKKKKEKKIRWE